jgi:hypothetical protein
MSVEDTIHELKENDKISECSILIRDISVCLHFENNPLFTPHVGIKVYLNSRFEDYYYKVSHEIQTESMISPDARMGKPYSSEIEAINEAIRNLHKYIQEAIDQGKEPKESWLVENTDF